ncbi:MAG TPA: hypothetical protein EYH31_01840 [Anaerolineae bacterium]|nr:hypothetical protein [Anaerolineae bacterium]
MAVGNLDGPGVLAGTPTPTPTSTPTPTPTPLPSPVLALNTNAMTFTMMFGGSEPEPQVLTISNVGGGGNVGWTASVTRGEGWLSISRSNGTTPDAIVVSVDVAGLNSGTYTGTISVALNPADAVNSPQEVSVTLEIRAPTVYTSPGRFVFVGERGALPSARSLYVRLDQGVTGQFSWVAGAIPAWEWHALAGSIQGAPDSFHMGREGLVDSATGELAIPGIDWLTISPDQGETLPATLYVSVTDEGIEAGSYAATVVVDAGPNTANRFAGTEVVFLLTEPGELKRIQLPLVMAN